MIAEGKLLWTPSAQRIERAQLTRFMDWLKNRRGLAFGSYDELWRWSVDDIEGFWGALWDYFRIIGDGRYQAVLEGNGLFKTRWFVGSKVNYAEHVLRHEAQAGPDDIAFYHSSEERPQATLSWHELGAQVRAVSSALRALGVEPGDRVVSYLPNVPETAIAMLATQAIGAVWSAAAPEFGTRTVVERFAQIEPKVLLATDGYSFGGKRFDRRAQVGEIVAGLPSLQAIVWLPFLGQQIEPVANLRTLFWDNLVKHPAPSREMFQYTRVAWDHPLWVLFSSGTTGLPKAIVHSHVGMLMEHLKIMSLSLDLRPGSCMFFYSTTGWMMWNSVVASLLTGCSAVLYDGNPAYPRVDMLWEMAERCGVTLFGASPTLVQIMEKSGVHPGRSFDLSRLETIILGGAPSTPQTYQWLYLEVASDLLVSSQSGGTELCSGLVGGAPILPVYAGELQARALGMAVQSWDDEGRAQVDEVGELVVTRPFPSMPLRFWGDDGDRRYHESYFDRYPGIWCHGDFIKINRRGGCYIYGRSDSTLNRFGVRIGTAEIYRALESMEDVKDSLVLCCETPDGGYFMPLFVSLRDGVELDEALQARINRRLREEGSPRHVPDAIFAVPGVPYTLTSKKMEIPVRRILMGAEVDKVASRDAMANPESIDWYVAFAQRADIRQRLGTTRPGRS